MKLREFVAKNGKTFTIHQTNEIPSNISISEIFISENIAFYGKERLKIDNCSLFSFNVLNCTNDIVAYGMIACGDKAIVNGKWCWIGGSIVLPEYRNIGIHKELIKFRMDFAKNAGYHYIKMQSSPKNEVSNANAVKCGLIYYGQEVYYNTVEGLILQNGYYKVLHTERMEEKN